MARQRSSAASAADRNVPSPAALAPSPSQTVTSPPRLVTRWSSVSAAPVLLRGYAARSRSGSSGQKPAASAAETDSSPAFSIQASRVLTLAAWESRRFPVPSCSVTGRSAAASTASPMACPVAVIRRSRSPPSRRNASVQ